MAKKIAAAAPAPTQNAAQLAVQEAFLSEVRGMYSTCLSKAAGNGDLTTAVSQFASGLKLARAARDACVAAAGAQPAPVVPPTPPSPAPSA